MALAKRISVLGTRIVNVVHTGNLLISIWIHLRNFCMQQFQRKMFKKIRVWICAATLMHARLLRVSGPQAFLAFCLLVRYHLGQLLLRGVCSLEDSRTKPIFNFRLKLQNIIQKLSEHCDIKNPAELDTAIVST